MRPSRRTPLVFLAGALAGAVAGVTVGQWMSADSASVLDARVRVAEATARELRDELRAARSAADSSTPRPRVSAADAVHAGRSDPMDVVADAGAAGAAGATSDAPVADVDVAARVATLSAQWPLWLERGDGDSALAALRELAGLVPDGRVAAMDLALRINEDVNGDGRLRLSDVAFYSGLGAPGVKELMTWALPRDDTPPGFRVMAAYSLPWTQAADRTLAQFAGALASERETSVQRALIANLGRLRSPEADRLVAGVLSDTDRDAVLRAEAAGVLAAAGDPGVERALEIAAANDPDATVRDAARAALVGRHPPATGFLVTGTVPESQATAAGLRAGDVVVRYDGTAIADVEGLRAAAEEAGGSELVPLDVVRGGEEIRVLVRPGRLGVYGRGVEAEPR